MSILKSVTSNPCAGGSSVDVTDQILQTFRKYGGSQSVRENSLAPNSALVHGKGPSLQKALEQRVTTAPFEFVYQGQIGLFANENIFFKIFLDIKDIGSLNNCFEEPGWECAKVDYKAMELDPYYNSALIDSNAIEQDPFYEGAQFSNNLPISEGSTTSLVSIKLDNEGTGNKYEDANVDARLYSDCRYEHPFDQMFVPIRGFFYLGIHARNTKRNGYNVKCRIGFAKNPDIPGDLPAFVNSNDLTLEQDKFLPYCP